MKKIYLLLALVPFLMASTCEGEDDPIVCSQGFVYGLRVSVRDASTGLPMANGVQVKAIDGNFQENLYNFAGQDSTFYGAGERMGTYTLTVAKTGYQPYISQPIGITANVCHVNQQSLTVDLQPE